MKSENVSKKVEPSLPGDHRAIIYPLIEDIRRCQIDPNADLRDAFPRLPHMPNHQIPEVTPAAWAKARLQLQRQAAS